MTEPARCPHSVFFCTEVFRTHFQKSSCCPCLLWVWSDLLLRCPVSEIPQTPRSSASPSVPIPTPLGPWAASSTSPDRALPHPVSAQQVFPAFPMPTHAPATFSLAALFSRALLNPHERAGDSTGCGTQGFLSFPGMRCLWLRGNMLVESLSEAEARPPIYLLYDTGHDGKESHTDGEPGSVVIQDPKPPTSWAHHPPLPTGMW